MLLLMLILVCKNDADDLQHVDRQWIDWVRAVGAVARCGFETIAELNDKACLGQSANVNNIDVSIIAFLYRLTLFSITTTNYYGHYSCNKWKTQSNKVCSLLYSTTDQLSFNGPKYFNRILDNLFCKIFIKRIKFCS